MAQSQGHLGIICETLLSADSDSVSSVQGLQTSGLIEGSRAWAEDVGAEFRLAPASALVIDGVKVVTARGGGRWLLSGGGNDPVEVYTLDDLPAPVAGVITLLPQICYHIHGEVDLGANRILMSAGAGLEGVGIALLVGSTASPLITCTTDEVARIHHLAITNNGGGEGVYWEGENSGSQLWLHDCSIYGEPALFVTGGDDLGASYADNIFIYDCRFYSPAAAISVQVSGFWAAVSFIGCRFLGIGDGIIITSDAAAVANMQINGC